MARAVITLTEAQLAEVETLAAVLTTAQIADYFGIGRTTFFAMLDRDPGVAERYKRGKARAIGAIAQSLIQKARNGDTASMIFYLQTQAGWRETDRLEHTGAEGGPVTAIVRQIVSPGEKLSALVEGYAARAAATPDAAPRLYAAPPAPEALP